MKRHLPFIAMTAAAFVLLFAAISRGDEPSPFCDAAVDALPDASVSDSLPVAKEVVAVSLVTPSRAPDCPDGTCRVGLRSQADESDVSATRDGPTRPLRRAIIRRFRRR